MVETFMLPSTGIGFAPAIILVVIAGGAALHYFFPRQGLPKLNKGSAVGIVLALLVGGGLAATFLNPSAPTIAVGPGQVSISAQVIGTMSFQATDMKQACTQTVGSGLLASMFKQSGTNYGNYNVGTYSLDNGATAYVVSDNPSNVVVELDSGLYLVLGPPSSNFTGFVSYFSENVLPVTSCS